MLFVHQALTWGFLLALLPLLIHLINLMRRKRVEWAAMEFLLQSYKKHRQWVWLKQLLLLLARIAAVLLAVAMLAQLKTREQWMSLFGGQVTHHYIVVDDSYSMTDRIAGASAFDAARQAVRAIAAAAEQQDGPQRVTLVRFSKLRGAEGGAGQAGASPGGDRADFNAEPVSSQFSVALEAKQRLWEPTALDLSPAATLAALRPLLAQGKEEKQLLYLVSDFRQKEWGGPAELRERLAEIGRSAELHFIDCARNSGPNLTLVDLTPADETRAAGVPLFVFLKVRNQGAAAVSKVQVKVNSTFYPPENLASLEPQRLQGVNEELATVLIDQIGPGETVTRRVQVYFPQPGKHVVTATLPEDSVAADNHRWCVVEFPAGEKTLLIDADPAQPGAYYVEAAFRPLERSNTGIRPETQPPTFLRDIAPEALNQYSTVFLLDAPRLDPQAIDKLEQYVRGGGGLAVFVGPGALTEHYNAALYKDGQGLLPAPLGADAPLVAALDENEPDLKLEKHPIFSFFLEQTNPLIRGVKFDVYRQVLKGWKPPEGAAVEVFARLRDGAPLAIEKKYGDGTVVQFQTTAGPQWNDWAKNPSYVVTLLKLQSYLATARRLDDPRTVGAPLELEAAAEQYRQELKFVTPGDKPDQRVVIERQLAAPPGAAAGPAAGDNSSGKGSGKPAATTKLAAALGGGRGGLVGETDRPGVYEAWPITLKGEVELRRWGVNVDPAEGDLARVSAADLASNLAPVKFSYHEADSYQQQDAASGGYNLSLLLMALLVALLLGEQWLAYSASYHPAFGGAR